MKLEEVFTKPKGKIKWVERSPKHYAAEYGVGQDRIFEFIALLGHTTDDMIYPVEDVPLEKIWLVGFAQKRPTFSSRRSSRIRLFLPGAQSNPKVPTKSSKGAPSHPKRAQSRTKIEEIWCLGLQEGSLGGVPEKT